MNCATLPVHSMVIPTVQMRKPWLKEFIQFTGGVGASLVAQMVKNLPAIQKTWVQPLGQEDPLEKGMATHSSILGEFQRQRSLASYNPWDHKELDMTEQLPLLLLHTV